MPGCKSLAPCRPCLSAANPTRDRLMASSKVLGEESVQPQQGNQT